MLKRTTLLLCCLTVAHYQPATAAENLLHDPGFENVAKGGLLDWRASSSNTFKAVDVVENDPKLVRSGKHAVKLVQDEVGPGGVKKSGQLYTQDSISLQPNAKYTLGLWARGEGSVAAFVYLYTMRNGNEAFHSSFRLPAEPTVATATTSNLAEWRQQRYSLDTSKLDPTVKSARFVLEANGTVYVDDCSFERADQVAGTAEAKPATATPAGESVRPNLLSVGSTQTPPQIDGTIGEDEYGSASTGIINGTTQTFYPLKNRFALSYDADNLYFGFTFQLPPGYEIRASKKTRDDSTLVASRDAFYLFLRPDDRVEDKGYQGVYLGVSPDGALYDAWEDISWSESRCTRDASFNVNWKVASELKNGVWTLELAMPWQGSRIAMPTPGKSLALSFGTNLSDARLMWQPHPNWFDHYQAFGLVRFDGNTRKLVVPSFGEISRGEVGPAFRLSNAGNTAEPYSLTYMVSTPKMIAGRVGGYVFDVALDPLQEQAIRDKSIYHWEEAGVLQPGEAKTEQGKALLKNPDFYVLEVEAKVGDKPVIYQRVPFHYSPPLVADLSPVPSKDRVDMKLLLHGARTDEKGAVRADFKDAGGRVALSNKLAVSADEMNMPVSLATLSPGDYKVNLTLLDKNGRDVATIERNYRKWEAPAWLKDRKGTKALNADWVPAPWTPLTVKNNQVALWGRTFGFNKGSLLQKLESQGKPLLASGMTVKYLAGGKEHTFNIAVPAFAARNKGRVELTQKGTAPGFSMTAKQRIEFDGMDRFDVAIKPDGKRNVERLWIEIPFTDLKYWLSTSREGMHGSSWQAGLVPAEGVSRPSRYDWIWLGNDQVGCTFFAENYKGWLINSRKPRAELVSQGGKKILRLLIVNEPSEVGSSLNVTFGLHPTPVKPFFPGWRNIRTQGLTLDGKPVSLSITSPDYWNSAYSKPSPRNWDALRDMIAHGRKNGQKIHPYIGLLYISPYDYVKKSFPFTEFPNNSPFPKDVLYRKRDEATKQEDYFYFKRDWSLVPAVSNIPDWETREEVRVTPSGSWADYFVHGVWDMLKRSDLDGLFLDIDNPMLNLDEEKGLMYRTKDGIVEGTAELFATRDMYKRLYYLFDTMRGPKRKPYLLGHGFPAAAPYMSFWDVAVNGEEIKPSKKFEATKILLAKTLHGNPVGIAEESDSARSYDAYAFRCIYGPQFGLPNMYLPQYSYIPALNLNEHSRETLSITFPHNTLLWTSMIPSQPVYDFWSKVEVPFGMGDTTFYPYWTNGVKAEPQSVKVSYWKKNGKNDYILAVANWSSKDNSAKITLPAPLAAFGSCVEMESGAKVAAAKTLSVSVPAHDLRVFRFRAGK